MATTSEDLVNKLFINPLDSIGRKLKVSRRRHTSGTLQQLSKSRSTRSGSDSGIASRSESVDFGEPIMVKLKEFEVNVVLFFCCFVYSVLLFVRFMILFFMQQLGRK